MSATQSSATESLAVPKLAFFNSENMVKFSRDYERLVKGFIDAAAQQIEVAKTWVEAGMEDISLLAQARTPDAFVHAEFEVFRRRSERAIHAAQRITEQMSRVWTETSSLTQPATNGASHRGEASVTAEARATKATFVPREGASREITSSEAAPMRPAAATEPPAAQPAAAFTPPANGETKTRSINR